jgi:ABC-type uncharacterized transport system involved in gliding motility auxiliary subunit
MTSSSDSHLIYNASDKIKYKVTWNKVTRDSEWVYFGSTDKINKELVINAINNHFADDILYVVFTRNESTRTTIENIKNAIDGFLGVQNFLIWDTDFKKAIEFNKIGTLRCGQLNA